MYHSIEPVYSKLKKCKRPSAHTKNMLRGREAGTSPLLCTELVRRYWFISRYSGDNFQEQYSRCDNYN